MPEDSKIRIHFTENFVPRAQNMSTWKTKKEMGDKFKTDLNRAIAQDC